MVVVLYNMHVRTLFLRSYLCVIATRLVHVKQECMIGIRMHVQAFIQKKLAGGGKYQISEKWGGKLDGH